MKNDTTAGAPAATPNDAELVKMINSWPHAEMISFERHEEIHEAGNFVDLSPLTLKLDEIGLTVSLFHLKRTGELHYASTGTHPDYGQIATFFSVRGPGEGARPRPAFIFYSGKLDDDVDFVDMTPADEAIIKGDPYDGVNAALGKLVDKMSRNQPGRN